MHRFLTLFLFAATMFADQVTLRNGDRLSGNIQHLADGKLAVVTEMAGAVVIPWANVTSIVSTQPLYVVLKNGSVLAGSVINSAKGLSVEGAGDVQDIARDEVASIRSYQEQFTYQAAQERKAAPHILDRWTGFLDTGLSAAHGNADVTTVTVGLNGARTTPKDKLTFTFNSLYARNDSAEPAIISADSRRGGLRYERNFDGKEFAFLSADGEADSRQQLDLRAVGGVGFGRHAIKNNRNTFDVFAGSTVNREQFSTGLLRLSAEALLSEESTHKINHAFTLRQKLGVFPNLTEGREYRMTFDSSAVTTLLRWLSWQVSVGDRYISDPIPGTVKNDVLLTTGFRFNLVPPRQ